MQQEQETPKLDYMVPSVLQNPLANSHSNGCPVSGTVLKPSKHEMDSEFSITGGWVQDYSVAGPPNQHAPRPTCHVGWDSERRASSKVVMASSTVDSKNAPSLFAAQSTEGEYQDEYM